MKNPFVILSPLLLIFFAVSITPLSASVAVSKDVMRVGIVEKMRNEPDYFSIAKDKKTEKRLNRLAKRIERKAAKHGMQVDFSDPVEQWLWFGLFGLGIAIFLSFFSFGFAGLIAFLAIVCLVIWVIKRGAL